MIKENKWKILVTTVVTLLPMVAGLILWRRLPEQMPIHWNAAGELDGWTGRAFAVFAIPAIMAALHLFCVVMTSLDPKVNGQAKKVLGMVFWICPVASVLVGALTYSAALGAEVSVELVVPCFVGLLFIIFGNYLPKCRRNYTIGIKVMWALEDEANWNATHRFAGKVWVAGGALVILLSLVIPPEASIWALLSVTLLMALTPITYSYIYYRRHRGK